MSPYSTFRTHLNTQDFAMLPNAIFSTLQGAQNPNTNQALQRAKNAKAQPSHPGLTNITSTKKKINYFALYYFCSVIGFHTGKGRKGIKRESGVNPELSP